MSLLNFIKQYYIDPIVLNQGYNFVNTFTYALLVVAFTWLTFKFLEKTKTKIDKKFIASIIPLIIFSVFIRLFEEAGIFVSYFLVTPLIWFEMFVFIFVLFLISKFLEKKFDLPYYKTLVITGVVLSVIPFLVIISKLVQFSGMLISLSLMLPFILIFYLVRWSTENKLVTLAHIFDGVATFTAIQFFGFKELHVVPRLLIGSMSPLAFVIVKIVIVVGILVLIDKSSSDKNFNNFLKLIIAVVGLAPALRDFFLLGLS